MYGACMTFYLRTVKAMKPLTRRVKNNCVVKVCVLTLFVLWGQIASGNDFAGSPGQTLSNFASHGEPSNSVILTGSAYAIPNASVFNVDLEIDCSDLFMGGSIKIDWDAATADLVSFSFATDGPEPLINDFTPSGSGGFVSWGWFQLEPQFSISGRKSVGTLTLMAKSAGPLSVVSSAVAAGVAAGPLVGPGSVNYPLAGNPLQVQYGGAQFYVIPEPGTALLVFLGLAMLSAWLRSTPRQVREHC